MRGATRRERPRRARPGRNRTKRRRAKRGDPRTKRHATVALVGSSRSATAVSKALATAGTPVVRVDDACTAHGAIADGVRAVVLVLPLADLSPAWWAARHDSPDVPVFVVAHRTLPETETKKLYRAGVACAFEWPGDKTALLRTMLRTMPSIRDASGATKSAADIAFEEQCRQALRSESGTIGRAVRVHVQMGVAILSGRVDRLWKLYLAEQAVAEVSGIQDVVVEPVRVTGPVRRDALLERTLRGLLNETADLDDRSLSVSVRDGVATLAGSVDDRAEADRLEGLVRHVRGVRRIRNLVTPRKRKVGDAVLGRRLEAALETRYPRSRVTIAVFGAVAVLTGRVQRASNRLAIERFVARRPGVRRVVNKLSVAA